MRPGGFRHRWSIPRVWPRLCVDPCSPRPVDYLLAAVSVLALALLYIVERNFDTDLERSIFTLREIQAQLRNETALLAMEATKFGNREHVVSYAVNQLGMLEPNPEDIEYILFVPSSEQREASAARAVPFARIGNLSARR